MPRAKVDPRYTNGLRDLYYFAKYICGFKDLSPKLHGEICEQISDELTNGFGRMMIVIPRDMFKSSLGVATCLWMFTRKCEMDGNYEFRTLIDSSTLSLSTKHISWIGRTLSDSVDYRRQYGEHIGQKGEFRSREIYVAKRSGGGIAREPNFMASAIRAEVTGLHFDMHWYDDLVSERNWHTKSLRQTTIQHYHNSTNLLEPNGVVLYTATPWHDGDLLGTLTRMEEERKKIGEDRVFKIYRKPALLDQLGNPDDINGESIFPERWPTKKLMLKKESLPRYIWRAQHMCDPSLPEHSFQFDRETMYVSRTQFPQRYRISFMTIDPNFRNEDQAAGDNACIVVGGFDNKMNWWGVDVKLGAWSADQFIRTVIDLYLQHRPSLIRIEKKFTSHLEYALRDKANSMGIALPIAWMDRDWRSKDMRYAGMEPIFRSGRIKFAKEIAPDVKAEMEEELERVGTSAKDDFLDALYDQFTGLVPSSLEDGHEESYPIPTMATFTRAVAQKSPDPFRAIGMMQMVDEGDPWEN